MIRAPETGYGAPSEREWLALAAILALALALRLWGLNWPLWYDEILTLETHLRLPWSGMMRTYSMNHHYLYSFEAKAAMSAWGEAPWALRLPALVFGLGSIALSWALARRLAGPAVALVTAALLALSFHHIWFSQNARGYTELAFWSTLGMMLFLRGVERPRPAVWLGFALTVTLAIFTHLTGAFFFLALGLVWLGLLPRRDRPAGLLPWGFLGFAIGLALTLIVYAPVFASLLDTVRGVSAGPASTAASAVPQYGNPLWTLTEAVRTAIDASGGPVLAVAVLLILLSVIGAVRAPRPVPLFGLIVLVHIVLTMLLLRLIGMRIWPRFFFLDIGFLLILVTLGVRRICGWFPARLTMPLFWIGVAGMLVISAGLAARNWSAPKQPLEAAIELVGTAARPGERIYAVGYASGAYESHYHTPWGRIMDAAEFAAALDQPGPVTLVIGFPGRTLSAIPEIRAALDDGTLHQLARLPGTLGDGAVLVLQR